MNLAGHQIVEIREYFRDKPVLKAYLFGSHARDEAGDDSDVDILVELGYSRQIGLEFLGMKLDLEAMLDRKVDLVSERALSKNVRISVEREKLLLYEKTH